MAFSFNRLPKGRLRRWCVAGTLSVLMIPTAIARPSIVTSLHPMAFIAHEIAGDQADIEILVPAGASPHTYSMRPSERLALEQADVFVWIGPEMETFLIRVMRQQPMAAKQIALGEGLIEGEHQHSHHHDRNDEQSVVEEQPVLDGDPHLWLDPVLTKTMAKRLVNHLSADPAFDHDALERQLERFLSELDATIERLQADLAPARELSLFTYHDAFQRFASRFDLNIAGHLTINPERRPGARRLSRLRDHLQDAHKPCVMMEPQFSRDWWNGLVDETNLQVSVWDPLGQSVEPGPGSYLAFLELLAASVLKCLPEEP